MVKKLFIENQYGIVTESWDHVLLVIHQSLREIVKYLEPPQQPPSYPLSHVSLPYSRSRPHLESIHFVCVYPVLCTIYGLLEHRLEILKRYTSIFLNENWPNGKLLKTRKSHKKCAKSRFCPYLESEHCFSVWPMQLTIYSLAYHFPVVSWNVHTKFCDEKLTYWLIIKNDENHKFLENFKQRTRNGNVFRHSIQCFFGHSMLQTPHRWAGKPA
jgi:hypothetical protein